MNHECILALLECIVVFHRLTNNGECDRACRETCSLTNDALNVHKESSHWANERRELRNSSAHLLNCTNELLQIRNGLRRYYVTETMYSLGSNGIPSAETTRQHQRIVVGNKVHFPKCSSGLYVEQHCNIMDTVLRWPSTADARMRIAASHYKTYRCCLIGNSLAEVD